MGWPIAHAINTAEVLQFICYRFIKQDKLIWGNIYDIILLSRHIYCSKFKLGVKVGWSVWLFCSSIDFLIWGEIKLYVLSKYKHVACIYINYCLVMSILDLDVNIHLRLTSEDEINDEQDKILLSFLHLHMRPNLQFK